MDYKITVSTEDDATLTKLLAKENAVRFETKVAVIPDVRAYAEQVVKWHAEMGAKQMLKAAKDAALDKIRTAPASVTAEDKAVLGIN